MRVAQLSTEQLAGLVKEYLVHSNDFFRSRAIEQIKRVIAEVEDGA